MVLVGASFPDAKAQVPAEGTCEPRTPLKTISVVMRPLVTRRLYGPSGSRPPGIA